MRMSDGASAMAASGSGSDFPRVVTSGLNRASPQLWRESAVQRERERENGGLVALPHSPGHRADPGAIGGSGGRRAKRRAVVSERVVWQQGFGTSPPSPERYADARA